MSDAYIVAARRTPIGKFCGGLASVSAPDLGAVAVKSVLGQAGFSPSDVDEVILGNVLSAGLGQAPARQAALKAGLPPTVGALTINKMCGSGLKAVMLAAAAIRCGDARAIVAGGMENMTQAPHLLPNVRTGWKYGDHRAIDSMLYDGLWCAFEDAAMGNSADYIARSRNVSREDQDAFAFESHQRAIASADYLAEEIEPVTGAGPRGTDIITTDEGPRADTTLEQLANLKPVFHADGFVTAGNASQISDGAAAVLVTNAEIAHGLASPLKARIVASATSGVEPKEIFIAPVTAIQQVLDRACLRMEEIDLFELNEAFAAQCLACMRPLEMDPARLNLHGGAIALGHPIGASGARVLVTLLHAMVRRGAQRGLAALCLGGGNAVAMIVERE